MSIAALDLTHADPISWKPELGSLTWARAVELPLKPLGLRGSCLTRPGRGKGDNGRRGPPSEDPRPENAHIGLCVASEAGQGVHEAAPARLVVACQVECLIARVLVTRSELDMLIDN